MKVNYKKGWYDNAFTPRNIENVCLRRVSIFIHSIGYLIAAFLIVIARMLDASFNVFIESDFIKAMIEKLPVMWSKDFSPVCSDTKET